MTFIVFDYGLRTQTPWYDIFPPKDVNKLEKTEATTAISDKDDIKGAALEQKIRQTTTYSDIEHGQQQRKTVYRAQEIMTAGVTTINEHNTINATWQLFQQHRFRHFPVVNDAQQLCGLISDRDILGHTSQLVSSNHQSRLSAPISEIMTRRVLTAKPDTEIRLLAAAMNGHRIGAMPIVDDSNRVIGMVTRSDILRTLMNQAPLELWS